MITDKFSLEDQVAVVTGGGRGLGRVFCNAFAEAGADIVVAEIDEERGRATAREIEQVGRRALYVHTDVSERDSAIAMAKAAMEAFGRIDVLMNNAGVTLWRDAASVTEDEWSTVLKVNLDGVFYCSQAVASYMIEARSGRIINIASMSGHIVNRPQPQASYNATKAAVIQLSKSLAVEWAPHNIRVNSISPGYMETEMTRSFLENPEYGGVWVASIPMGRPGDPAELAGVALFLATEASSYVTGSDIAVDGGYTCW